jgi:3-hydroxy-3-methylglutaryl CoA synthase
MTAASIGVAGVGVHVPRYRLQAAALGPDWGGAGGGWRRAVANHDEDSLTMAVEAGLGALGRRAGAEIEPAPAHDGTWLKSIRVVRSRS